MCSIFEQVTRLGGKAHHHIWTFAFKPLLCYRFQDVLGRFELDLRDAALYVASYENRLASDVTAGENRGRTLEHDYVVLEWLGPYDLGPSGRRAERLRVPLLPKAVPEHSGVVAFVQNRRSLEVLQALMLPACAPGAGAG